MARGQYYYGSASFRNARIHRQKETPCFNYQRIRFNRQATLDEGYTAVVAISECVPSSDTEFPLLGIRCVRNRASLLCFQRSLQLQLAFRLKTP